MPAVETDSALHITRIGGSGSHIVSVGLASEVDTATKGMGEGGFGEGTMQGSFLVIKRIRMVVPSETDIGRSVARIQAHTIKANETDVAFGIVRGPKTQEHDFALPMTVVRGGHAQIVRPVGQCSEIDVAQRHKAIKPIKMNLPAEVDVSLPHKHVKRYRLLVASEVDVARSAIHGLGIPVGIATTTSVAFSVGKKKIIKMGFPLETDRALGLGAARFETVGLAQDAEVGLPVVHQKQSRVGMAVTVNTALPFTVRRIEHLGPQPKEIDLAIVIRPAKQLVLSQIQEHDSALAHTHRKILHVGMCAELDHAPAFAESFAHYPSRTRSGRIVGVEET